MRKWLVAGTVVVALAAALVFAGANLNSYLNRNKDWLAAQLEGALARPVSFDEIGVSIFGGFGVRVLNLHVADDPRFSREAFVRSERVQVVVKILPAIFGRYEVTRLIVEKPVVVVIRTASGFNFDTIGTAPVDMTEQDTPAPQRDHEEDTPAPVGAGVTRAVPLLISALEVRGGEIRLIDRAGAAPGEEFREVLIRRFDFSASDVSFTDPIRVKIAAAILGNEDQNCVVEGTVGPVGEAIQVETIPILAEIQLDPLDVDALRRVVPEATAQIPADLGLSGPVRMKARLEGSPSQVSVSDLDLVASVFAADEPNLVVRGAVGPVAASGAHPGLEVDLQVEISPVVIDEIGKLRALAPVFPPTLSAPDPVLVKGTAKGTLDRLDLNLTFDGSDGAMSSGSAFVKPKGVPLQFNLEGRWSGRTFDVTALDARLATLSLSGNGSIVMADPISFDVHIDVHSTQLDGWNRLVPTLAGSDLSGTVEALIHAAGEWSQGHAPKLTGTVSFHDVTAKLGGWPHVLEGFSSTVELKGDRVVLPPTGFRVGGSPVKLQAEVHGFQAPVARFTLHSPELRAASVGAASESGHTGEVFRDLTINGEFSEAGSGPSFRGTVRASSGRVRDVDFQDLGTEVRLAQEVLTLDGVRIVALGGEATGSGHYDMREAESPKFDVQSRIEGMQLRGLLASRFPDTAASIEGYLHANLSLAGTGQGWETIRQTLRGGGKAELREGALKDVNITNAVLGSVTGIPGLSSLIPERVRAKYPELFHTSDTRFDTLGGSARIADGRVVSDDLLLAARDYTISGRGAFTFENQVDFTAMVRASKRLSDDVVADVPIAKHLTGPEGRLEIPFHLTGALPHVRPRPDVDFLARAIEGALVEEGIGKLLDGISGDRKKAKKKEKKGLRKDPEMRRKGQKQQTKAKKKQQGK